MAEHAATNSGVVQLSDAWYDLLRQFVEKVFPGLGLFYAALAALWHWGYTYEVGGTFAALSVLGGVILSMSRKGYEPEPGIPPGGYDGAVVEDVNELNEPILRLQLDTSAAENLLNKKQIVFKGFDPSA